MGFLVKLLGSIDLAAALAFLLLVFGIQPWTNYILFCSGLLFIKGLFILTGDILSLVDLVSAIILILSLFLTPATFFLWFPTLLLCSKGMASFL
jgi:hypothetical protein